MKKRNSLSELLKQSKLKLIKMNIQTFGFNPILVNTYVVSDETGEGIIIDPGNCNSVEDERLKEYIKSQNINIKFIVNTHPHIDHIAGNPYCATAYNAPIYIHGAGLAIYNKAYAYAIAFGMSVKEMPQPKILLQDGDEIRFGNTSFTVFYTPGHCDGSICLYNKDEKIIFTGDVIFEHCIGRSDLPTGNENLLQQSIREKIMTLDDNVTILSGHGDKTTVGNERKHNTYIR